MANRTPKHKLRWTEQVQWAALLLSALGYSDRKIAECLGCDGSTVGRHLGPRAKRPEFSAAELIDLFERYDAQRNIEEAIVAVSGSIQQARLRTSLRRQSSVKKRDVSPDPDPRHEELSDEQLRRDVESLVGQTLDLEGPD